MNPYYRVACVGYSHAETRRFSAHSAQENRLVRFVPVADVGQLQSIAPRRRFDAILISTSGFDSSPVGSLSLSQSGGRQLPIFVSGPRRSRMTMTEDLVPAIYISFLESPVESAAFRLCTDHIRSDQKSISSVTTKAYRKIEEGLAWQEILDGCSDAIVVTDANGGVQYANAATGWLFGLPCSELMGSNIDFLARTANTAEYILPRPSGELLEVEIETRDYSTSSSERYIHTIRNVTERNARQHAVLAGEISRGQIEKWQNIESLATGISHQFNNLLMIILGRCNRMKENAGLDTGLIENILQIEKSSTRAADITNHLLTFAGQGRFDFKPISISEMLEKLHYLLDAVAFQRAVIEYNLQEDIPPVKGDQSQLQRLFFDVINNSLESFQSEKGIISITTGSMMIKSGQTISGALTDDLPTGQYAYVQISDTGCGMNEETLRQIFQPFYTTKSSRKGLGLSAALGIVRGHHGAMEVHSMPGRGTTVEIFLPVAVEPATVELKLPDEGGSQFPYTQPLKLLITDDEADLRDVLSEYLVSRGCDVVTAEDGQICIDRFKEHQGHFDCIILDMSMPNMDGAETFENLKNMGSQVPVIITSGFTDSATIARLKDAGALFLQKPYQLYVLEETMKRSIVARFAQQTRIAT